MHISCLIALAVAGIALAMPTPPLQPSTPLPSHFHGPCEHYNDHEEALPYAAVDQPEAQASGSHDFKFCEHYNDHEEILPRAFEPRAIEPVVTESVSPYKNGFPTINMNAVKSHNDLPPPDSDLTSRNSEEQRHKKHWRCCWSPYPGREGGCSDDIGLCNGSGVEMRRGISEGWLG